MKPNWLLAATAVTVLGLTLVTNNLKADPAPFADGASEYQPTEMVQVQVEFVEMSHEDLTKLLFLSKPAGADATKLRQTVQETVARNEAKVLETQLVVVKSGQKATSESVHEFIYPSGYEEPKLPDSLDGTTKTGQTANGPAFINDPGTPTAFDTRNVGSTLEVEATVREDSRFIDLRLVPELVWHTGANIWHEGKDKAGNPFRVQMPDFYAVNLNTAVACVSGQYLLASVISPKDDKGEVDLNRKVMIFVKCDVLEVK